MSAIPILCVSQLKIGDVVLSVGEGREADIISKKTECKYTHAAIVHSSGNVAEMTSEIAVSTPLSTYQEQFLYHAVFRQISDWTSTQTESLQKFVNAEINAESPYDKEGLKKFRVNLDNHLGHVLGKLRDYYAAKETATCPTRQSYTCSQFVASCFVATGHIVGDVAVVFNPDFCSVSELGDNGAYGAFVGFLEGNQPESLASEDRYKYAATREQIRSDIRQKSEQGAPCKNDSRVGDS